MTTIPARTAATFAITMVVAMALVEIGVVLWVRTDSAITILTAIALVAAIGMIVLLLRAERAIVRRLAEANRKADVANEELRAVIDTAPAGLVVMNRDGTIRLQNRAAEALLGIAPRDPVSAKTYWRRFRVQSSSGAPVRLRDVPPVRALAGEHVAGAELEIEGPDGRRAEILVGAAPLRDESGVITGAVAGFQDITRHRDLDRLRDEFVAVVSHELRTPLTAIQGSLQLLLAEKAVAQEEHRELLAVALRSCGRLVRIVNDVLDLSKIEAGRLELRIAPVPVASLVGHSVDSVRPLADQAGVRLEVRVDDGLPDAIRGDVDRLTQAIVNLISNAIKFAPRGSTVTVAGHAVRGGVGISVSNEGRGITPEEVPRLFQKFQQLDSAGTRRSGGTGLGLVITKAIVEQHGGRISVTSAPGKTTTFTLELPVEPQPA